MRKIVFFAFLSGILLLACNKNTTFRESKFAGNDWVAEHYKGTDLDYFDYDTIAFSRYLIYRFQKDHIVKIFNVAYQFNITKNKYETDPYYNYNDTLWEVRMDIGKWNWDEKSENTVIISDLNGSYLGNFYIDDIDSKKVKIIDANGYLQTWVKNNDILKKYDEDK